jgi:type VI protein secretion system component Hcp
MKTKTNVKAGAVSFQEVSFTKYIDKSSPKL